MILSNHSSSSSFLNSFVPQSVEKFERFIFFSHLPFERYIYYKRRTMERGKSVQWPTFLCFLLSVCVKWCARRECGIRQHACHPAGQPTGNYFFLSYDDFHRHDDGFFSKQQVKESKKKTFPFFSWRNKSI